MNTGSGSGIWISSFDTGMTQRKWNVRFIPIRSVSVHMERARPKLKSMVFTFQ